MKILLTGANGQLGCCFKDHCPDDWELIAADHQILDITNLAELDGFISKKQIDVIVNAAAYTAVDKAETEYELAQQVNELGPQYLAIIAEKYNIKLIHISTDYVFDGCKNAPYVENDITNPINVYGVTKRNGEVAILAHNSSAIIIRTSWVFSEYGNNFVKTILKLAKECHELNIINDQFGCPTYAGDLAGAIVDIINIRNFDSGIYHYSGNNSLTWYEFAIVIIDIAYKLKIISKKPNLIGISSNEYLTIARRPLYSILNCNKILQKKIRLSNWLDATYKIISKM